MHAGPVRAARVGFAVMTVLCKHGKQDAQLTAHGRKRQRLASTARIQVIAQMNLRQLAQNIGMQRQGTFTLPHAVETRHQLDALIARELTQRRERMHENGKALFRVQSVNFWHERLHGLRHVLAELARDEQPLSLAHGGLTIERQCEKERTRRIGMASCDAEHFRQATADLLGTLHMIRAGIAHQLSHASSASRQGNEVFQALCTAANWRSDGIV